MSQVDMTFDTSIEDAFVWCSIDHNLRPRMNHTERVVFSRVSWDRTSDWTQLAQYDSFVVQRYNARRFRTLGSGLTVSEEVSKVLIAKVSKVLIARVNKICIQNSMEKGVLIPTKQVWSPG